MSKNNKPLLVFVTGISGAGRSVAIKALEDSSFYCIDNLPCRLIDTTCEYFHETGADAIALGLHINDEKNLQEFLIAQEQLKKTFTVDVIFLTCDEDVIITRYNATRRKHPLLDVGGELLAAIRREKALLANVEKIASAAFDTSIWSPHQLTRAIESRYAKEHLARNLYVSITSFGFKYGALRPADSIIDVRFLDNPYFVKELKEKNGLNKDVKDFILKDSRTQTFLEKLIDLHKFLLPNYYNEGKNYFRIGIGCTGGKHRSVFIAEQLAQELAQLNLENILISVMHRDVNEFRTD